MDPIWAHFVGILAQFGVKKTRFSQKNFGTQNHFTSGPGWSGTLKTPKLALQTPNGPHFGVLRHFRSPRNPLDLAHKSSALFNTWFIYVYVYVYVCYLPPLSPRHAAFGGMP